MPGAGVELGRQSVAHEVQSVAGGEIEGHRLESQPAAVVHEIEREGTGDKGAVVVGIVVHAHGLQPELDRPVAEVQELGSGNRQGPPPAATGRCHEAPGARFNLQALDAVDGRAGIVAEWEFQQRRMLGREIGRTGCHGAVARLCPILIRWPELNDSRMDPHLVDSAGKPGVQPFVVADIDRGRAGLVFSLREQPFAPLQRLGLKLAAIDEQAAEGNGKAVAYAGHVDPALQRHGVRRRAGASLVPVGVIGRLQVQGALRIDQQGEPLGVGFAVSAFFAPCRPADDICLLLRITVEFDPGLDREISAGKGGRGNDPHRALAMHVQRPAELTQRCDGRVAEGLALGDLRRASAIRQFRGVEGAEEIRMRV